MWKENIIISQTVRIIITTMLDNWSGQLVLPRLLITIRGGGIVANLGRNSKASSQCGEAFSFCRIVYTIINMKNYVTENSGQTKKMGELLAMELKGGPASTRDESTRGGEVICLEGDLGAGKTTFTQGLLKGLKAKGPYTSPTFVIMKEYNLQTKNQKLKTVYHIDAYRVGAQDILNLGWEEIIADPKNIVIVEWAERIKKILPKNSLKIKFEWVDENKRKISLGK